MPSPVHGAISAPKTPPSRIPHSLRLAILCVPVIVFASISTASAMSCANLQLAWNPSTAPGLAGYNVQYGTASGVYTQSINVGNTTSSTVSNLVVGANYYFVVNAYNTAGVQSPPSNEVVYSATSGASTSSPVTVTSGTAATSSTATSVTTPSTSSTAPAIYATFIQTDTTTRGNWPGVYGSNGAALVGDALNYPAYATVTTSAASSYTWTAYTADPRAFVNATTSSSRLAACWYTGATNRYTFDVNLTDGNPHQLAIYALDWDNLGPRNETIQILNPSTGTVLDTRSASSFQSGEYLVWAVRGHIQVVVTNNVVGSNAVISGLFFDPTSVGAPAPVPEPLQVTTTAPFTPTGTVGGPYPVGSKSYALADAGSTSVAWQASATQKWLSLSSTGGTLSAGGTATVDACVNSHASTLASGTYDDTITLTDLATGARQTQPVLLTLLPPPSPTITSPLTSTATSGTPFSYQITATNPPSTFSATGLPPGLALDSISGLITGTPALAGASTITITASNAGGSGSAILALTLLPPPPVISGPLAATAISGLAFSYQIPASNGPTSYAAAGLPAGLGINPISGLISGTPSAAGTSTISITAANAGGSSISTLLLSVLPPPPVITSALAASTTSGLPFSYQITATNGPTGYGASNIPAGLALNTLTGLISGVTATSGTTTVAISAANASGTAAAALVLTVLAPPATSSTTSTTTTGTAATTGTATTTGSSAVASALYVTTDGTTQGNWKGKYGADGFNTIADSISYPSYAAVTPSGALTWAWATSTSDPRALQKASSSMDRNAACWYTPTSSSGAAYTIDLNLTDGNAHQLSLYFVDWDGSGKRSETVQLTDPASGNILDTEAVSSFQNGLYLIWKIQGHIRITVTNNEPGSNAVVSGLFFDAAGTTQAPKLATAQFVTLDATTQGNWSMAYGSDGYNVIGNTCNYPAYAAVTPITTSTYTWAQSTTDIRGLQKVNRVAACWTSGSTLTLSVNLTDGNTHPVAIYALDWFAATGSENVQITDASSGAVLDTESLSSFQAGQYLLWNLKGNVNIQVTNSSPGTQAVLSGIFFGAAGATPQNLAGVSGAQFVTLDTSTQGNWRGVYGTDGYNVAGGNSNYPQYASVTISSTTPIVWQASTGDVRAPEIAGTSGRIAGCWYTASASTFAIDLNLTDGNPHKVALYAVDWDADGPRSEQIEMIDATTGIVLDTRTLNSFFGGQYLVWNVQGHVQLQVTNLRPGTNAVVNGLFFGNSGRNLTY